MIIDEETMRMMLNAAEAVRVFPIELQPIAFDFLLNRHIIKESSQSLPKQEEQAGEVNSPDPFINFYEKSKVDIESLKMIYRIEKDGKVNIIISLDGPNSEKQKMIAYLYLFALRFTSGREWVNSSELSAQIKSHRALDGNFSRNLRLEKEGIQEFGVKNKKQYKLTQKGVLKTKELILSTLNK